jgi:5,10-methylenetetrahydrofolate reductase
VQVVADCNRGIDLGGVRLAEPTTFAIGVRLGVDDLDLAETLAQAGAQFCTLQPVYEPKRFRDALAAYAADLPLLAEILVLPDADTAEELDAEVPVLSVPRRLVERLAEDPDEDVRGVLRFLGHWRDRLAGVCLMLPDERSEQAAAILEELRR